VHAGIWGLGLATSSCNLHKVPLGADINSWVLRHDGTLYHNGQEIGRLEDLPLEGDIIVSSLSFTFLISYFGKLCTFCNTVKVS